MKVTVIGKRKREIGLVVPAQYDCYTKIKRISVVLDKDLRKRKEKYLTLELFHQNKNYYRKFPVFSEKNKWSDTIYFVFLSSKYLTPILIKNPGFSTAKSVKKCLLFPANIEAGRRGCLLEDSRFFWYVSIKRPL